MGSGHLFLCCLIICCFPYLYCGPMHTEGRDWRARNNRFLCSSKPLQSTVKRVWKKAEPLWLYLRECKGCKKETNFLHQGWAVCRIGKLKIRRSILMTSFILGKCRKSRFRFKKKRRFSPKRFARISECSVAKSRSCPTFVETARWNASLVTGSNPARDNY